ncbi:MAG: aminopeptidase P family protein [Rhodospirillaceae bacterium]|jgi:Xaa-Pro aminopeptidase|nr:aminopeptidase P family protein [Rhodospirillaceae bacterium]MBT4046558.1 aminopeptidase P family protein [Rhodospirillaceae bacterium]MBT4689408.1 aminopeptidase P family protein [Rhodospirillaceae bacterium]MBT5079128.1 aminopeptidase P family protein [Rhodospirillaceae bacterium]MBT5527506.1 aminopeptidase P family protein [Rhodospirillaceae bacterium]
MLFNRERCEKIMAKHGLDALVAASPDNVLYATNYECVTHWLNKGFQLYSLFSPGHDPVASLIAPSLELDAIVDGDVWVDDIYLFSPFLRGPAQTDAMDQVGRDAKVLSERAHHVGRALDGLVASIESRGLEGARIGVDESGISPLFWWELQQRLPNVDIVYANAIWWKVRMVKTQDEIARLTRASAITEASILEAFRLIKPGVTERTIIDAYHSGVTARGGRSTFCILGSGSRTAQPHALPSDKVIEDGDLIRYDIGCTYGYYHADNARAVVLGTPSAEHNRIYDAMAQGVDDAVNLMRPGADVRDVYKAAMAPGQKLGLENFERFHCGHGIGVSVYDPPVITLADPETSAFLMPSVDGGLEPGMTFSIEVGYYIQGVMGFLCEDTVVVTENGVRRLTGNSKSLDLAAFIA